MIKLSTIKGNRLRILKILGADWVNGEAVVKNRQRMNVTGIIIKLRDLSQSLTSQELRHLRDAGLVVAERKSKEMFYELAPGFEELVKDFNPDAKMKDRALKSGKNRQLVVKFLRDNPDSQVKDICPELGRDTVSQELSVLRKSKVAVFRKEKNRRYYSLI